MHKFPFRMATFFKHARVFQRSRNNCCQSVLVNSEPPPEPLPNRFRTTSGPLPDHFRTTSKPLPNHFRTTKSSNATSLTHPLRNGANLGQINCEMRCLATCCRKQANIAILWSPEVPVKFPALRRTCLRQDWGRTNAKCRAEASPLCKPRPCPRKPSHGAPQASWDSLCGSPDLTPNSLETRPRRPRPPLGGAQRCACCTPLVVEELLHLWHAQRGASGPRPDEQPTGRRCYRQTLDTFRPWA